MPETGEGISEIRIPYAPKSPDRDLSRLPSTEHLKSAKTSLIKRFVRVLLSEKEFRPEDFTPNQIASNILTFTRNPLRDMARSNPYANGFEKRTMLSNMGHFRPGRNPNSPAYTALSQSLEQLVREGALRVEELEEPRHDEFRYYWVENLDKLRQIADKKSK